MKVILFLLFLVAEIVNRWQLVNVIKIPEIKVYKKKILYFMIIAEENCNVCDQIKPPTIFGL